MAENLEFRTSCLKTTSEGQLVCRLVCSHSKLDHLHFSLFSASDSGSVKCALRSGLFAHHLPLASVWVLPVNTDT